ncbi:MAG: DUF4175 family protein, partial [Pseudomonadota bacterium]
MTDEFENGRPIADGTGPNARPDPATQSQPKDANQLTKSADAPDGRDGLTLDDLESSSASARKRKPVGLGLKPLLASTALLIERAAPVVLVASAPLLLVVFLSMVGLWAIVPAEVHWAAISVAVVATGLLGIWVKRRGWPSLFPTREETLRRLERDGRVENDAVLLTEDALFRFDREDINRAATRGDGSVLTSSSAANPDTIGTDETNALWEHHQAQMAAEAKKAAIRIRRPDFDLVDPIGFRYGLPSLLAMALVFSGDSWLERLGSAFSPTDPALRQAGVIDMWIEPPRYTSRPPIYLMGPNDTIAGKRPEIEVPVGSKVVIQTAAKQRGLKTVRVEVVGEDGNVERATNEDAENPTRSEATIQGTGEARVYAGSLVGRFPISVIRDTPPSVFLTGPIETTEQNALRISGLVSDDYGIASAFLELRIDTELITSPDAVKPSDDTPQRIALQSFTGQTGERLVDIDLVSHPWAGSPVLARILVTDGAGQEAFTTDAPLTLPARTFSNPLAQSVVEQRRDLSFAPERWRRVQLAFNGLTLHPDLFYDRAAEYLMMRSALWRITGGNGEGPEDVGDTVDALWPLALQLENQLLADARAKLEAAEKALREALKSGATDAEIAQLTEALRQAMQDYIRALAQSPQDAQQQSAQGGGSMGLDDLNALLDSIKELGQSGARNAAQQALDQLAQLLNNLQITRGSGEDGQSGEGQNGGEPGQQGEAGEAADLIGRQRELADQTFSRRNDLSQGEQQQSGEGQNGESGQSPGQGQGLGQGQGRGEGNQSRGSLGSGTSPFGTSPLDVERFGRDNQPARRPGQNRGGSSLGGLGAGAPDFRTTPGENLGPQNDLAEAQKDLSEDLNSLLSSLGGIPDAADAQAALNEALEEMENARQALSQGALDAAGDAMAR